MAPSFKPPGDYKPHQAKKTRKIYIPKDPPDYNFIGLIIGPRGQTQKEMEKKSGAKIAIRGRGSIKEGKSKNQANNSDGDELHVLLTADTDEALDIAEREVRPLLVPVEEGKNEHKRQQLRRLAEYNGTLREHQGAFGRIGPISDIICRHCGETSHPSSDCPAKEKPVDQSFLETEYKRIMAELGEDPAKFTPQNANDQGYAELMQAISKAQQKPEKVEPTPQPGWPQPGTANWYPQPGYP